MAELMTGGISAAFAIFFANMIRLSLKEYKILEIPAIDSLGILISTILVVSLYYLYIKVIKPSLIHTNNNNNKNN